MGTSSPQTFHPGAYRRLKDHTTMIIEIPAAPADPELITLTAFLRRFSVSKSSFYRMASRGEAPDVVVVG